MFTGRESELRQMLSAYGKGVILVSGPAGIGKTVLARVFAERAKAEGLCSEYSLHRYGEAESSEWRERFRDWRARLNDGQLLIFDDVDTWPVSSLNDLWHLLDTAESGQAVLIAREHTHRGRRGISASYIALYDVRVEPLSDADARSLVMRLAASHGLDGERMWEQLSQRADLPRGSPLMLNLMVDYAATNEAAPGELPASLEGILNQSWAALSAGARAALTALVRLGGRAQVSEILALARGDVDLESALEELHQHGMVLRDDDETAVVHVAIMEWVREHTEVSGRSQPTDGPTGTLYITVNPAAIPARDVVDLLETLNSMYRLLGGNELVIREEEIGTFESRVEVPV